MKKTYIKPNLETIALRGVCVLNAVSGDGVNVGISKTGASGDADSRSFDFTDD